MAQTIDNNKKKPTYGSAPQNGKTTADLRAFYDKYKDKIAMYEQTNATIKLLRDVAKTTKSNINSIDKSSLQTYLKNIGTNEKGLRNLSRYLYYRCQPYYKLITYNANMFCLNARSVIPNYSLIEKNDKKAVLQQYSDTIEILDKMNLQYEYLKLYTIAFREDVAFGCAYLDEEGFFILPLDPDYCKINGFFSKGDYSFAMDMSYFKGANNYLLEYFGEPFVSMYNAYGEVTSQRWQDFPEEYGICLKQRGEDSVNVVPPFSGIFNSIINLLSKEDLQSVKDEQEVFKLIWMEMETQGNAKAPNQWKVDPDLSVQYYNKLVDEAVPDNSAAAIVPGKLNVINFADDYATEVDKVAKSTETLFNTSGGAQILNSATISGTTAFKAAIIADTEFAISMLLPQTELAVNRLLKFAINEPAKVKFLEMSVYTKEDVRKELVENATYGLPTQLALNSISGFSEKDTLALNFLEQDCLNLANKFIPVSSTHTQSGKANANNKGGRPKSDDGDLTDDGEASRDKSNNKK